jgi:hypothetical protein
MDKELELLNIEIDKARDRISDTATGISMLGLFFLAIMPLFYSIVGIYGFTVKEIQLPLIISVAVVFIATILSVLNWELNTKKLKGLYERKQEIVNNYQEKVELTKIKKK